MFEYMIGQVVDKKKDYIVLLVNNIAYRVFTSKETMESDIYDGEVKIYMNLVVREDDMSLYGFANRYELDFFSLITTVNGVGPKTAIG
ncbi:MAG: Holliday junction branch migration protein RuvA, partial [Fenollaria massiliensis]